VNIDRKTPGVAILCNRQGGILKVIHDDFGICEKITQNASLSLLVSVDSIGKTLRFLSEIVERGAAFDWELNIPVFDQIITVHFAGVANDGNLLILGAKTSDGVLMLCEEMTKINNEQMNALRIAIKEKTIQSREEEPDSAFHDEISRLNNELVNMHRELARKNSQLGALNEQKNQFLGMVAHDLRNPLSVIIMYSRFLIDEVSHKLDNEYKEFLSIIQSSSKFMLNMVDDLLDVAKIESGKLHLDVQPTDLKSLIERNLSLNRILAAKKQIELRFQPELNIPEIELDAGKIDQVLNNLTSNAVKFSPPNSTVDIYLTSHGDRVTVCVKDNGPGIPSAEIDKLFKPFTQTSVRSPNGEKSSGLGLAIARKIIQGHNGKIWVDSQVGKGSAFYFSLPVNVNPKGKRR
jgi:signal transduction histidine kinase